MNSASALGLPIVYLVDDEDVVRDALGWLLRSRRLLSEGFASAEAFEAMLAGKSPQALADWPGAPSCLLLDVRMPGIRTSRTRQLGDEGQSGRPGCSRLPTQASKASPLSKPSDSSRRERSSQAIASRTTSSSSTR